MRQTSLLVAVILLLAVLYGEKYRSTLLRFIFSLLPITFTRIEIEKSGVGDLAGNDVESFSEVGQADTSRWHIYKDADSSDNHGSWTNWMPEASGKMIKLSLVDKSGPFSGSTSIRVDVNFQRYG